jgi:hypothetical protein
MINNLNFINEIFFQIEKMKKRKRIITINSKFSWRVFNELFLSISSIFIILMGLLF